MTETCSVTGCLTQIPPHSGKCHAHGGLPSNQKILTQEWPGCPVCGCKDSLDGETFRCAECPAKLIASEERNPVVCPKCNAGYLGPGPCPLCALRWKKSATHPPHYASDKHECIDVMREIFPAEQFVGFCRLSAFKYLWRAGKKGDAAEDAAKAEVYCKWWKEALK